MGKRDVDGGLVEESLGLLNDTCKGAPKFFIDNPRIACVHMVSFLSKYQQLLEKDSKSSITSSGGQARLFRQSKQPGSKAVPPVLEFLRYLQDKERRVSRACLTARQSVLTEEEQKSSRESIAKSLMNMVVPAAVLNLFCYVSIHQCKEGKALINYASRWLHLYFVRNSDSEKGRNRSYSMKDLQEDLARMREYVDSTLIMPDAPLTISAGAS